MKDKDPPKLNRGEKALDGYRSVYVAGVELDATFAGIPLWVAELARTWEKTAREKRELVHARPYNEGPERHLLGEAEAYEACAAILRDHACID